MKNYSVIAMGGLTLLILTGQGRVSADDFATKEAQAAHIKQLQERPLVELGIDLSDPNALMSALESKSAGAQLSAANLLSQMKYLPAVPALAALFKRTSTPYVKLGVGEALHLMGADDQFQLSEVVALLGNERNGTNIRAAGLLAKRNSAAGWPLIRNCLRGDDITAVVRAGIQAPLFEGLIATDTGQKIQVFKEVASLFSDSTGEKQTALLEPIVSTAKVSDLPELENLLKVIKPADIAYKRAQLVSVINRLNMEATLAKLRQMIESGDADKPGFNKKEILEGIARLERILQNPGSDGECKNCGA